MTHTEAAAVVPCEPGQRRCPYPGPHLPGCDPGPTHRIALLAMFLDDHEGRDLLIDPVTVVARRKGSVTVDISERDLDELLSDAQHYASFSGSDLRDNMGLCSSARATVTRIRAHYANG